MSAGVSILVPTRRRRAYLAHALASVAAQASAHGAEIVVVEDDPPDPETEALVAGFGGRYLALGAPCGINEARNAALETASGELLCFLDDDVEVWPGWLDALVAAAAACPDHDAFGGPIRPRLEGVRLLTCGREPVPITSLDLGPENRDATFAWGANLALRRGAIERIGQFDAQLGGAGDEEDWQRRLREAGGRIRYVAAAGVDHRRAGRDARLPALSRAAYHRGRHARRWDARKGTVPSLAAELRTLAGCMWHTVRRRCANGIVLTALTAGRLREAVAPTATDADRHGSNRRRAAPNVNGPMVSTKDEPDYLSGQSGTLSRRTHALGTARDVLAAGTGARALVRLRRAARHAPRRGVLVVTVARPEHAATTARARRELARSRHAVRIVAEPPAAGAGKWANVNAALDGAELDGVDWLLLVDDDVVLPRRFLDVFLLCAERYGFRLAQPAHAFASHAAWTVTRRRPDLVARRTRFVEIGPVTAIHRDAFGALLPFPDLRMGWGLDNHWSAVAAERGWPIGIVDATPVRHLRPVAHDYPHEAAIAEAEAFLDGRAYVTRAEAEAHVAEYR